MPVVAPLATATWDQFGLSVIGTAAAATIYPDSAEPIVIVSVYRPWDGPGQKWQRGSGLVVSEANAHWIVADISMLSTVIDHPESHRIVVAGDWSILRGYGEEGSPYWAQRYGSVFKRMEDLGFVFCGPEAPDGGIQVEPWPAELSAGSRCVPTFRSRTAATRQMDFVVASASLNGAVRTRALNRPEEWGPSDHCIIEIEIDPTRC